METVGLSDQRICLVGHSVGTTFGEGLHQSFATPNPFVLTNKICLNKVLMPLYITATNILYYLFQFVEAVGLSDQRIHLVGQSLGGTVAVMYAAMYENHIERATFIAPACRYNDLTFTNTAYKSHYPPGNHHASHL